MYRGEDKNGRTDVYASGEMTLSDGTAVTVELCMKKGTCYNDTMKEYFPGIDIYPNNYKGSYVVAQEYAVIGCRQKTRVENLIL